MKKRMLSLLTALCLMLTLAPAALAADNVVTSKDELISALSGSQETIVLGADIDLGTETLTISHAVTIDGTANGMYEIEYSGTGNAINITATDGKVSLKNLEITAASANAYAVSITSSQPNVLVDACIINAHTRGINMYPNGGCTDGILEVTGTNIYNTQITNYETDAVLGDTRAIALFNVKSSEITITNSELMGFGYSINISGDGVNSTAYNAEGTKIDVTGSKIYGWSAFNIWTINNEINITNSHLKGINKATTGWNDFATVVVNNCYYSVTNLPNVFNISGGSISAYSTNDYPIHSIFRIDYTGQTKFNFTRYNRTNRVDLSGNDGNTPYIFGIPSPGMTFDAISTWFSTKVTGANTSTCSISSGSYWVPTLSSAPSEGGAN